MSLMETEEIKRILGTMDEDQLELFMCVFSLYQRMETTARFAEAQAQRLFKLLSEEEYDLEQGWVEADMHWNREGEDTPDEAASLSDDGSTSSRREHQSDASETVDLGAGD